MLGDRSLTGLDPKYEEEVSGCTASVGIVSREKIWVVCTLRLSDLAHFSGQRRRLEIGSWSEGSGKTLVS